MLIKNNNLEKLYKLYTDTGFKNISEDRRFSAVLSDFDDLNVPERQICLHNPQY